MTPLLIAPLRALVGAVLLLAVGAGAGWTVNGWRLQSALSEERAARADEKAVQAVEATLTLHADAQAINRAASDVLAAQRAMAPKFEQFQKALKNAKPLPRDCRPDDLRVRTLEAGIDAANAAAAGH